MLRDYIYTLFLPAVPFVGALVCLLMTGLVRAHSDRRLLKFLLIGFYTSQLVMWFTVLLYSHAETVFSHLSALCYLAMLMVQVCFFHFAFRVTQRDNAEKFSPWHYIIPFLIAGIQEVWMLMVPFDVTLELVQSKGIPSGLYPAYSAYFLFKIKMRLLYSVFYAAWILIRIHRYRHSIVNYSSDETRTPLTWLKVLAFLTIAPTLLPLSMAFHQRSYFFSSTLMLPVMSFILLVQYALLSYNFVTGNYVQILDDAPKPEAVAVKTECNGTPLLNREKFEGYMLDHKPYLNPGLRIVDLVTTLGTNRSYLSSFINTTYGINFSQLINRYRLEEYRKLEQEHPGVSKSELALKAGFGSYRSFTRIKNSSEKQE